MLRIVPAYWFVLLVVAFVFERELMEQPGLLLRNALLIQNYDEDTLLSGIGPAWSLAVEAVFYVTLPLLVVGAWLLRRPGLSLARRRLVTLAPAVVLLVVGLSGKLAAAHVFTPEQGGAPGWQSDIHSIVERSFWAQADLFTWGMALAVLSIEMEAGRVRLPNSWRPAAIVAMLVLAFVTAATTPTGATEEGERGLYYVYGTATAIVCAFALGLVVLRAPGSRPWPLVRLLESRFVVAAGLISYGVFLWHEPIVLGFRDSGLTLSGTTGFLVNLAMVAAVTGLLSVATYRYVELPALKRKRPYRAPTPMPAHQAEAAP